MVSGSDGMEAHDTEFADSVVGSFVCFCMIAMVMCVDGMCAMPDRAACADIVSEGVPSCNGGTSFHASEESLRGVSSVV